MGASVFMTRLNFFYSANRYMPFMALVFINLALFFAVESSHIKLIGKVEALGYSWLNYTDFRSGELISKFSYINVSNTSETSNSISYNYDGIEFSEGGYITLSLNGSSELRFTRVFSLDEKCSLFFYGPIKMSLNNLSLRCLY